MAFLDFLFGEGEKTKQFQRFTEPQQDVLNQLLGGAQRGIDPGMQYLMQILSQDPEMMRQFEAPTMRQFQEETLPTIAERFTGRLGAGAQRSSAFGQQLGQAGERLQEKLGAQRAQLGFSALQQLQSLLGTGLTPRFETMYQPRQPGFFENLARGATPGLAQYGISSLLGGL